jgi:hypothetical protein
MYAIQRNPHTGIFQVQFAGRNGMGFVGAVPNEVEGACAMFRTKGKLDAQTYPNSDPATLYNQYATLLRKDGFTSAITEDAARGCYMEGYNEGKSLFKDPAFYKGGIGGLALGVLLGIGGTLLVTKVIL